MTGFLEECEDDQNHHHRHHDEAEDEDLVRARDKAESVVDATVLPPVINETLDAVGIPNCLMPPMRMHHHRHTPQHQQQDHLHHNRGVQEGEEVAAEHHSHHHQQDPATTTEHDVDLEPHHQQQHHSFGDHDHLHHDPNDNNLLLNINPAGTGMETVDNDTVTPSTLEIPEAATAAATDTTPKTTDITTKIAPADVRTMDVLCGRGASVNAHEGNKKFRALCFLRKPDFENGNLAARRRVATEIVFVFASTYSGARFLKRNKGDNEFWYEMNKEQAIRKAAQVMRDYRRPDRLVLRRNTPSVAAARAAAVASSQHGVGLSTTGKRNLPPGSAATPMDDLPSNFFSNNGNNDGKKQQQPATDNVFNEENVDAAIMVAVEASSTAIAENPYGVHDHDVLSGRGAFVNGHVGNTRLRHMALRRKSQFDGASYCEKRGLATEIVTIIRSQNPPGRFLKRIDRKKNGSDDAVIVAASSKTSDIACTTVYEWEELSDEKAIHKACQVMRDINRPDRQERELRRKMRKQKAYNDEAVAAAAEAMDAMEQQEAQKQQLQLHHHQTSPHHLHHLETVEAVAAEAPPPTVDEEDGIQLV